MPLSIILIIEIEQTFYITNSNLGSKRCHLWTWGPSKESSIARTARAWGVLPPVVHETGDLSNLGISFVLSFFLSSCFSSRLLSWFLYLYFSVPLSQLTSLEWEKAGEQQREDQGESKWRRRLEDSPVKGTSSTQSISPHLTPSQPITNFQPFRQPNNRPNTIDRITSRSPNRCFLSFLVTQLNG